MTNQQTRRDKFIKKDFGNPIERERVLMQYGGIFRHNIEDFAKNIKRTKPTKNLSR